VRVSAAASRGTADNPRATARPSTAVTRAQRPTRGGRRRWDIRETSA
jgi:hypothetical protein